ncbi:hypothetical protein IT072_08085 [Leifsonia sp. ZF2019]|uniref:hypothetical protein n=1 Tax=Leifsonia sp. ZF2019 TaxID=2781978 RepID=UPI001CBFB29C|nr:hypothetical protein [Leifsonia sp. ZF2019]UAJ80946.1 hypothetical protein IT072_08085 [Leifsonia sp. ZF2019]
MRRTRGIFIGLALALAAATGALAGCATSPAAAPLAAVTESATPTPTPTDAAVNWRDSESMIILPSATTSSSLPHGPSWVTAGGHLRCGIYDDWVVHDQDGNRLPPQIFYGCRIDPTAATLTYPDFDSPGKGMVGGCPSGFSAIAGSTPSPLCNSGQVFSSETDHSNVLEPGQGVRFAGIECVATGEDAMSCTEPATGHGFRASLSDYALF